MNQFLKREDPRFDIGADGKDENQLLGIRNLRIMADRRED